MPEQDSVQTPQPAKPRLKISVKSSTAAATDATPTSSTPVVATPSSESAGPRKLKIKVNPSQPPTPAATADGAAPVLPAPAPPVKTKAGRQSKPSAKLIESKKRPREDDDEENEVKTEGATLARVRKISRGGSSVNKVVKIRAGSKIGAGTQVIVKPKGRPPTHPPGDGYDSEASDRERDPAIEEQFIMRMPPGEHCDYVRSCMENGKMGAPKQQGGADVALKFFEEDSRRAMVTVKGQPFAAVMVDLPTITEAMKTWDKKSFMKSADICQMLLVYQQVKDEAEARKAPLPSVLDSNFKWPHGLTPPMHDCVNRRFAKTISRKEIEDKEAEVERLLAEDSKAQSTKWEWVDERADEEEEGDEDAEGEVDESMGYFNDQEVFEDDDLAADIEAAFANELAETPAETPAMDMTTPAIGTPIVVQDSIETDAVDEEEEDDDDEDDDDDDDDDLDVDERAERGEHQAQLDMIQELEKSLANREKDLAQQTNKILRIRIEQQIKNIKGEIELKKSSIGMTDED